MHISVITLFPEIFQEVFSQSIIKRAIAKTILTVSYVQLRQFATDAYGSVDDHPYGGGHGMVLRVDIVDKALEYSTNQLPSITPYKILLDASGAPYKQKMASELTLHQHIILLCGHYEGVDARVFSLVDSVISIGDYILTGGEIPAMVLIDSIGRLLPGTLSKEIATIDESFSTDPNLLEYPQYTRPNTYNAMEVPEIVLSGNHKKIADWRKTKAIEKTKKYRPDLL